MFYLLVFTITAIHLACPYVASDKFSCTEPDQRSDSILQLIEAATLWNEIKKNFITRFSERLFELRHQLAVEPCWLDDMNGIPNAQQNAKRTTQTENRSKGTMTTIWEDLNQVIYN